MTIRIQYVSKPCIHFYFVSKQPNFGLGRLISNLHRSHKITQTPERTPLNEWPARRRGRYLDKTQQANETNTHAVSGIRTRDPRNRAAEDICLRSRDYRYSGDRTCKNHFLGREADYSTLVTKVYEKPTAFVPRY